MAVELVTWAVRALGVYAALGLVFALPFLSRGVRRIDPVAGAATRGFRVMILPGVVALWPLLLRRWCCGPGHPPQERGAHRRPDRESTPMAPGLEHDV